MNWRNMKTRTEKDVSIFCVLFWRCFCCCCCCFHCSRWHGKLQVKRYVITCIANEAYLIEMRINSIFAERVCVCLRVWALSYFLVSRFRIINRTLFDVHDMCILTHMHVLCVPMFMYYVLCFLCFLSLFVHQSVLSFFSFFFFFCFPVKFV